MLAQVEMSINTVNALGALLEAERQHLQAAVAAIKRDLGYTLVFEAELDGDATVVARRDELQGELRELQSKLLEIEEAKRRIARGTFGVCVSCGKPIPLTRLVLMPWVARDFDCDLVRWTAVGG